MDESTGSWIAVFSVVIALDFLTALLAITVLKTLRVGSLRIANLN